MRSEDFALEPLREFAADSVETWRRRDHIVGNTGKRLNAERHRALRVDQARPLAHGAAAIDFYEADFDYAVRDCAAPGRLEIQEDDALVKHRES